MQEEIWKDVPGYEWYYQVSNLGRVKSLSRIIKNTETKRTLSNERILKPCTQHDGYLLVIFRVDKQQKGMTVHALVAMAFLGHVPCGHKIVVDHMDGNKKNNHLENLQLISSRENTSKSRKNSCGFTGVSRSRSRTKPWKSTIGLGSRKIHLGYFKTPEEASAAYQDKVIQINNQNN